MSILCQNEDTLKSAVMILPVNCMLGESCDNATEKGMIIIIVIIMLVVQIYTLIKIQLLTVRIQRLDHLF